MDKDMTLLSKKFLICCYFGQSNNLIKAAIDRAYVDMAAHTLKNNCFENNAKGINDKWECRYNASCIISNGLIKYPNGKNTFAEWHEDIIKIIISIYGEHDLTEGQAQKWLNMTIKYLFVFYNLFGSDDELLSSVKTFFKDTSVNDYKCPIDSYVLKGAGVDDVSWSKLNPKEYNDKYDEIKESIGYENDFIWELQNWEKFASEIKPDRNSYAEFYNNSINKNEKY